MPSGRLGRISGASRPRSVRLDPKTRRDTCPSSAYYRPNLTLLAFLRLTSGWGTPKADPPADAPSGVSHSRRPPLERTSARRAPPHLRVRRPTGAGSGLPVVRAEKTTDIADLR